MPLPSGHDAQINTSGLYTKPIFLVAALPATAECQGRILWVSDLTTNPAITSGQVAAGGGTTLGRVISDGSSWRVYGWST
jgi:hypothetical protein